MYGYLVTLQVDVDALSAGLSPCVGPPGAEPGASPFENNRLPEMVEGPPAALPSIAIRIERHPCAGILSVPLESLIVEPSLLVIVQPSGNVWPLVAILAIA